MKISQLATAALFASVLAASADVTLNTDTVTLTAAAGSDTKAVEISGTTTDWSVSVSSGASWLTAAKTSVSLLTFTATANTGSSIRTAKVKLTPVPADSGLVQEFVVVQGPAAATTTTTTTTTTPADTAAPTITITTASTVSVYQKAVLSGKADDTGGTATGSVSSGVQQVYWRDEGSSKWRKAMMSGRGTVSATWFINVTLKKKAGRRIYIKAVDGAGNEAISTDRYKWDTSGPKATPTTGTGGTGTTNQ